MKKGLVTICMLVATGVAAADDTTARGPLDLRADRYIDAAIVARIAEGARIEPLKSEAGWVQVRADGRTGWVRATGLRGDGATVASLARLDSGRSASGNLVVAAGIRRIPRSSRHALIIGVDAAAAGDGAPRRWPGVVDDLRSARLIAERIGVAPDDVIERPPSRATLADVLAALDEANERVRPGDQLLVYFSGPGTQVLEDGACVAGVDDARRRGAHRRGAGHAPEARVGPRRQGAVRVRRGLPDERDEGRRVPQGGARGVLSERRPSRLPIVERAQAAGVPAQNVVALQSAPGVDQGLDLPRSGGVFTQALADCFLGDAVDLDRSTSISIAEVATCANGRGRGTLVAVAGQAAWSPIVGVASTSAVAAPNGTTSPRAAIDDVHAQRDGRIDVTLTATPSTLRIGRDFLDLTLTSTRAGFVYLVLLGSDGKSFYLLFPNDLDRDNRIAAGETLRLPRPSWRVQGQGPAGRDTVLAIVAESERDLAQFAANKEGPFGTALTDRDGRAQLQWLLGRSGHAASSDCVDGGQRRNLAAVPVCSDAFGAALVEIVEQ